MSANHSQGGVASNSVNPTEGDVASETFNPSEGDMTAVHIWSQYHKAGVTSVPIGSNKRGVAFFRSLLKRVASMPAHHISLTKIQESKEVWDH